MSEKAAIKSLLALKKHLPFVYYVIFSTTGVIAAIVIPKCFGENFSVCHEIIGAAIGVAISILGSWFTYYSTTKGIQEIETFFKMEKDKTGKYVGATFDPGEY